MHPWYSPWAETIITDALAGIGASPAAFLAQACQALTPGGCLLLPAPRANPRPVPRRPRRRCVPFASKTGSCCALDQNGTLVVPLSCDFAIWAERAGRRAEEFAAFAHGDSKITGLTLWVDGRVSERLAQELATRKIALKTDVLARP